MNYNDQYLNQVEASVLGSSALSGGSVESVDPYQALLQNALLHFSQYSAQRTGRSAVLGDYPDPMTISYHVHPQGNVQAEGAADSKGQRTAELRRITPGELRSMTAYHESNRAELIFELAKDIRRSNFSDIDKRWLRNIERSLIDGDLTSFQTISAANCSPG